jgi:hypothetical protein
MFKIIKSNSSNTITIEASGKITKEDYSEVLKPLLDNIKDEEKKIKLLFHTKSDFDGYTSEAVWEDFKLGIHHFLTFEKCAIVTDESWIKNSCKFFSPLIPCPVKIFEAKDLDKAQEWLASEHVNLECILDEKHAILTVDIKDSLSAEDFKILSKIVDPWIEKNGKLEGIIIHVREFPYWENVSGLLSHISFVKNHHRDVKKVAVLVNDVMTKIIPKLANHFVKAELRHFDYDQVPKAKEWILE